MFILKFWEYLCFLHMSCVMLNWWSLCLLRNNKTQDSSWPLVQSRSFSRQVHPVLSVGLGAFRGAAEEGAAIIWWSPASPVGTTLTKSRLAIQCVCSGNTLCAHQHVGIPACSAGSCPKRILTGVTAAFSEVLLLWILMINNVYPASFNYHLITVW